MLNINKAFAYAGTVEELQLEMVGIRKAVGIGIANNMKPLFESIKGLAGSLPCGPKEIDQAVKLMSTFWGIDGVKDWRPDTEAVVYLHKGLVFIQFFGISNLLIEEHLSKNFLKFDFTDNHEKHVEMTDESFMKEYGCSMVEFTARGVVWYEIFAEEGVPLYRGFTLPVLHEHYFDITLLRINQELLKVNDPAAYKAAQKTKREKVEASVIDSLLKGLAPDEYEVEKLFNYNGIIEKSETEYSEFLEACKAQAISMKETIEKTAPARSKLEAKQEKNRKK